MNFLTISGFRNLFVNMMLLPKLNFGLIVKIKGFSSIQSTFSALEAELVQYSRCFKQFYSIHLCIQYLIL